LIRRRLLYPIPEAAYLLGLSEKTLRRRIAEGALETVRDGRRVFVTAAELGRYVSTLAAS
jgi:excisionase family DNA binding protein